MTPILYPTMLPDNDGDGEIVSSGKIAVLGPKGTIWIFDKETPEGFRYVPKGWVEPLPPVQHYPSAPAAPEQPQTASKSMQFIRSSANIRKQSFSGGSAVRKLDTQTIVDTLVMEDLTTVGSGRLLYMPGGSAVRLATFNRIEGINVMPGQPYLGVRGLTDGNIEATVTDLKVVFSTTPNTDTGDFPAGFQGGGKGDGEKIAKITMERVYVEGAISKWSTSKYWNGDGVAMERCVQQFEATDIDIKNCIDGGLDTKAVKNKLLRVRVEGCLGNYKLWDDTDGDHLTSIGPVDNAGRGGRVHFRLMGDTSKKTVPTYNLTNIEAIGADAPLFWVENGEVLITATGTFDGTRLVGTTSGGKVAPGSTWNGEPLV